MRGLVAAVLLAASAHAAGAAERVALVTGATSGLGLETSVQLAGLGYTVVMAGRDPKAGAAAAATASARSGGRCEFLQLDLGSIASVARAADELKARYPALSVLVNNAGVLALRREETGDGVEADFAVSHLGHFELTRRLLPALQAGAPSRVVSVSSVMHRKARWDWADPQLQRGWNPLRGYANAKLAVVWFTRELARRLPAGVTAVAVHPGGSATNIFRGLPRPARWLLGRWLPGPAEVSRPIVRLASSPDVEGVSGRYFEGSAESQPSAAARDDASARRLWGYSEGLVESIITAHGQEGRGTPAPPRHR